MNISEIKANKRKDRNTWGYTFHVDGKRYRKSGFKTKSEALRKAHEHVDEIVSRNTINTEITFEEYYKNWIEIYKKYELSKGQYGYYVRSLNLFNKFFGENKLMRNITRTEYQKFINWYGKGRTKSTLLKVHQCISQVIRGAYHEGILKSDPTYRVQLNYTKESMKEELKYLNMNDYLKLIEYFKSRKEKSYLLLYILAITGARFSEVNNLTYNDLNLDSIHLPGTKTINADRTIGVNVKDIQHIRETLSNHPRRLDNKLFGLSNKAVIKSFKRSLNKLNIDSSHTPYSLRHTHCSYLLSKEVPIEYISKRLGHANIKITLEIYSHLFEEDKNKNDDIVRELFK